MAWIVESFARVMLSLVNGLLLFFLKFYDAFEIDVGTKISNGEGLFDTVFPYASHYVTAFTVLAYAILILYGVVKIIVSMTTTETKDTPVSICGRLVIGGLFIKLSYEIVAFLEVKINVIYLAFKDDMLQSLGKNESLITDHKLDSANAALTGNTIPKLFDTTLFENSFKDSFITAFVLAFCGIALIINLFKLTVEVIERYALLGLIYYTAPLAFATVASKESNILKCWIQMLFSQFILLISNLFFITIFANALTTTIVNPEGKTAMVDFVVRIFLLLAWLILGQKFDEHLRNLGLGVAQSGS